MLIIEWIRDYIVRVQVIFLDNLVVQLIEYFGNLVFLGMEFLQWVLVVKFLFIKILGFWEFEMNEIIYMYGWMSGGEQDKMNGILEDVVVFYLVMDRGID